MDLIFLSDSYSGMYFPGIIQTKLSLDSSQLVIFKVYIVIFINSAVVSTSSSL